MEAQMIFKRVEKKYLLTAEQFSALCPILAQHMQMDQYGRHTICNVYYDTPDYQLIRASLEKPVYKEKLRLRSYGTPGPDSTVFVELKKKYKGVVYKRREAMSLRTAREYLAGSQTVPRTQILREMDYFLQFYRPEPKVYLAYDRVALFDKGGSELRITFDRNIRFRTDCMALEKGDSGALLPEMRELYLMEVKIPDAMPLWLSHALSVLGVFPSSFSKYGCCYEAFLSRAPAQPSLRAAGATTPQKAAFSLQGGMTCA